MKYNIFRKTANTRRRSQTLTWNLLNELESADEGGRRTSRRWSLRHIHQNGLEEGENIDKTKQRSDERENSGGNTATAFVDDEFIRARRRSSAMILPLA